MHDLCPNHIVSRQYASVKCFNHPDLEATAVCIHCGSALCSQCVARSKSGRVVCSPVCSSALQRAEEALVTVRQTNLSAGRVVGYLCLSSALVFACFGFIALRDGVWQLCALCESVAVVLAITGTIAFRIVARKEQEDHGR